MKYSDKIKICDLFSDIPSLFSPLFEGAEYPWELLSRIKDFTLRLVSEGAEGYSLLKPGVLIGRDVKIAATATIEGATVIGHGTTLRPGAYLRGGVLIGEGCVIGNSTELKNCLLLEHVQAPHYNYVGDSVLGRGSHMGAGAVCSNLKSDGKNVVIHGAKDYETGLRKVGAFLGDRAEIGCGCVLSPGTAVGQNSSVYPLTHLRGVIPSGCIVKSADNIVFKK